ncbi:hypothetical protein IEQ34_005528 [Dendrobium chrysotoxum]|uniref:Uncharacterized protein n=1 Tax=Dendrobium chrysotoxum TaxID=161865 RepID=A0AAV7HDA3_DENCH|nr:hypothetical protein IEQ34_005528 [Dendrobium chrysotoxum]
MASNSVLDVWGWLVSLPPVSQWNSDTQCFCIYRSEPSQPSLNLRVIRHIHGHNPHVIFSLTADFNSHITLWSSNSLHIKEIIDKSFDSKTLQLLLCGIIAGVLKYESYKKSSISVPGMLIDEDCKDIFNLALLTLALLVCIYEAPQDLRFRSIEELSLRLYSRNSQESMKQLVRILGSNLEEQWMRSVNLAITNWIMESRSSNLSLSLPSPFFAYSFSTVGLWKVQLYCPITAMISNNQGNKTQDSRLNFSLNYQQLEGVIQFTYKVIFREYWIDIVVKVDNIRCDVNQLVSEKLISKQGHGSEEKHFPSRILLQLAPTLQTDVISVSVSKSSDNPIHEVGVEKGVEGSFEPPGSYLGLKVSASETVTLAIKPWKFEQSVHGDSAVLNWFLHDGVNGREVFSTKPPKMAIFRPRSWFRNRYSSAYRPFTRQGGVIFAGDEYGESVWWKICRGAKGKRMDWEICGKVWLTYWPNKHRTFYSETRTLEFKELLHINLEM